MQEHPVEHLQTGINNLNLQYDELGYNEMQHSQQMGQYYEQDDSDDDQPLSKTASVLLSNNNMNNHQGPTAIRNINNNYNTSRPPQFIKPASQPAMNIIENLPADIQAIQYMYDRYTEKIYIDGYLAKYNDLTVDGSPYGADKWTTWYVELCGPVLTMWDAETPPTVNEEGETTPVIPQYINLADANVYISDEQNGVFSLNSAGSNRFLFQPVEDAPNQSLSWVSAIRLSCFEWSRIHQIYTKKFTQRYINEVAAATKSNPKMEGYIQARLPGETGWEKYWAVVSDSRDEKKLFGKKKIPTQAQLTFYENKKQKNPLFTITNIDNTYTLYPESPQLIEVSTILKVEGVTSGGKNENHHENNTETSSTLIMATSRNELIQWLIAVYDSFKLYGRPNTFFDDVYNANSLNFGDVNNIDSRLFLEVDDIQHNINIHDTFAQNKVTFSDILLQKLQGHIPASTSNNISNNTNNFYNDIPNTDHQPTISRSTTNLTDISTNNITSQDNRRTMVPSTSGRGGKLIYASDESDDDEEHDEDEDESEDEDILLSKNDHLKLLNQSAINPEKEIKNEENETKSKTEDKAESKNENKKEKQENKNSDEDDDDDDNSTISDVSETSTKEQEKQTTSKPRQTRNRQRVARPQASVSGSGTESDEEEDDDDDYSSDGDEDDNKNLSDYHINQQGSSSQLLSNQHDQFYDQQHDGTMYDPSTGMYYDSEHVELDQYGNPLFGIHSNIEIGEDGPVIPELGSHFATQNSLLDTYRPDHPTARDQIEYARQTGATLLNVPEKPPEPRTGLVGMINQIEVGKKSSSKNRMVQMEKEKLLERERERYLWEQRQQMLPQMNQPTLMNQMNSNQPTLMNQMNNNQPTLMNQMNNNNNNNNQFGSQMNLSQFGSQMNLSQFGSQMNLNQFGSQMNLNQQLGMNQMNGSQLGVPQMSMLDPRMSMMPPMMNQLPMMDPRMSMFPMNNPAFNMNQMNNNLMMDPRMSMQMPQMQMFDPRMSMLNMQMMMAMYQNNGLLPNQQLQQNRFGSSMNLNDGDDEDDDVPLGGHRNDSATKK